MENKIKLLKIISSNSKKVTWIIGLIILLFQAYWLLIEYKAKRFQILTEIEGAFNASIMAENMKILGLQLEDFSFENDYSLSISDSTLNSKSQKFEFKIEFDTVSSDSNFKSKTIQMANLSDTTFNNGLESELIKNLNKIGIDVKFKIFTDLPLSITAQKQYTDTISPKYSWFKTNKKVGLLLSGVGWQTFLKMKYSIVLILIFLLLVLTTLAFLSAAIKKNMLMMELKKNFTNSMTHELKTPLSTIAVAIESLEKYQGIEDKQLTKEYFGIMKAETKRLIEMVNSILLHSKLNESELLLKVEKIYTKELFTNCIDLMKPKLNSCNGEVFLESGDIIFEGDAYHLTNVFMNLIDNALKYSNQAPVIRINCDVSEQYIHIHFKDNGIGISNEFKDRIFEPYFRIQEDDLYLQKGFGLGLSYVKEIIKLHKGNIELLEGVNKGTYFLIKLPLQWKP
jgi:signal transduction histidine kinase